MKIGINKFGAMASLLLIGLTSLTPAFTQEKMEKEVNSNAIVVSKKLSVVKLPTQTPTKLLMNGRAPITVHCDSLSPEKVISTYLRGEGLSNSFIKAPAFYFNTISSRIEIILSCTAKEKIAKQSAMVSEVKFESINQHTHKKQIKYGSTFTYIEGKQIEIVVGQKGKSSSKMPNPNADLIESMNNEYASFRRLLVAFDSARYYLDSKSLTEAKGLLNDISDEIHKLPCSMRKDRVNYDLDRLSQLLRKG